MKLLVNLRGVPADEAEEIRELLERHDVDYYETSAGAFGISQPGIWLRDEGDTVRVTPLLEEYQQQRQQQAREEREQRRREGSEPGMVDSFLASPLRFIGVLAVIGLIVLLSTKPFIDFFN